MRFDPMFRDGRWDVPGKPADRDLCLVTQTLLVPMRLHAFAALVLGNFSFPSFFKRAHSVDSRNAIQPSNQSDCNLVSVLR